MKINFIYSSDVSIEQMLGYEMAALTWGSLFTDNIEVNILAKSTNLLNDNVIGGATPEFHEQHYALFLQYFEADITSEQDRLAYDALQQGNTIDFLLDRDVIGGNTKLKLTTALAKSLGMGEAISLDRYVLDEDSHFLDGTIMMNQNFAWDFNYVRDSAAAEDTLDFLSVALHETGHILGFTSSLDFSLQQDTLYSERTELSNFSPLDLFRFSAESLALDNPDGMVNDLSVGGVAWFSTDGGETLSGKMSTGKTGDGFQASHWERRYDPLGIMDPTLWYQERASISDLDVLAFDVMGYDLSENAADVEYLFEQEGLESLLAQAKVQLAHKLGVSVEWIEENADVPVSSLELIEEMELAYLQDTDSEIEEVEEIQEQSATDLNSDSDSDDDFDFDSLGHKQTKRVIKDLNRMMKHAYQWWAQGNKGKSPFSQEFFEWWAQSNQGKSPFSQEFFEWWAQSNQGKSPFSQEFFEWWVQGNKGKSPFSQEAFEWWVQNNQGKSPFSQEFFEWVSLDNRGKSPFSQEIFEWMMQKNKGRNPFAQEITEEKSWWQDVFVANQNDADSTLENLELPGQNKHASNINHQEFSSGHDDLIVSGDDGNDSIIADKGDDLIDGAAGHDTIFGANGFDTIFGFDGNDSILGGEGDDLISGESDKDALFGEAGHDVLMGGDDDDYLDGGEGRDFLNGNIGDDALIGGAGDDAIEGEAGKDLLVGEEGQDIASGGSGDDFIFGDSYSESLKQSFGDNINNLTNQFVPSTIPQSSVDDGANSDGSVPTEFIYMGLDHHRIEAEQMTISGSYKISRHNIWIQSNNVPGFASTNFTGKSGYYEFRVGYLDENDGDSSSLSININGEQMDNWMLDKNHSKHRTHNKTRTIAQGLYLDERDIIEIQGLKDGSDNARVNYLEFIPLEPVEVQNNLVIDDTDYIYSGLNQIKLEAEDMTLAGGYRVNGTHNGIWVHNEKVAGLATTNFTGESGYYEVRVRYFDENDGSSSLDVRIDGQQIDSWIFNSNTSEQGSYHLSRTISAGMYIDNEDLIQIRGIRDGGESSRVNYLEFIPLEALQVEDKPQNEDAIAFDYKLILDREPIKIEAEDMTFSGGYQTNAQNNEIWVHNQNVAGLASTNFSGESGYYQVLVRYFDQNNGNASLNVKIDDRQIDSWILDKNQSQDKSWYMSRTVSEGMYISANDSIEIRGIRDGGEASRVDYIEFIPVEPLGDIPDNPDDTSNPPEVELPVELQLGANSDILRGGAGNDGIDGGEGNDIIFGEDEFNDSSYISAPLIDGAVNYGNSSYILSNQVVDWEQAQAEAQSYGGNLVTINDAAEEAWIRETFGTDEMWIGLTDVAEEGVWEWSNGDVVTYTNWKVNEPNNVYNREHYATVNYRANGEWNDRDDRNSFSGIIEIDWSSVGGNDTIVGGTGDDLIYGNSGNDLIYGDLSQVEIETVSSSNEVDGGNDTLTGNGGHDNLEGGAGNDILNGTDEIVAGNLERDILTGGTGNDRFVLGDETQAYYATGGNQDYAVIKDFEFGLDSLQLHGSAIDYSHTQQGNDIFLYGANEDLVAILKDTATKGNLNLDGSYIEYVNNF